MFQLTRSKIIAGAAVALLGAFSAVAGFTAPGDTGVPDVIDSPACDQVGCTEAVDVPGGPSPNLPTAAADGIAGAEANRPEDLTLGPPEDLTLGPPEGLPSAAPGGLVLGPPEGLSLGPPEGLALGPPEGLPLGPQDDLPDLDPEDEEDEEDEDED